MWGVLRVARTTWPAVAVAVLLPLLAWLQYDWVNQLATADRERRERTLRAAGSQFTAAVDSEIARLGASLQLDGAMVERRDWDAYALRYDAALDGGLGALVDGVWFAELSDPESAANERVTLHAWQSAARTFEPQSTWPETLASLATRLNAQADGRDGRHESRREFFGATGTIGDERTLVMPVLRVQLPRTPGPLGERIRTDVRLRGYTIVTLDLDVLAREHLPRLVAEHFPIATDYRVAVVTNEGGRVVYESVPGAAADTTSNPDLSATFMQPRVSPMAMLAQIEPRDPALGRAAPPPPPPPPPAGVDGGPPREMVSIIEMRGDSEGQVVRARARTHGHWTLRVKHAAGSLEAAVAASRRRNLGLSGGILALLGVVVALIAVSARRAQALARRQMEFVAAVSHELRTPVAVINSAASNLADGVVADPARVARYGATIQTEARRLGDTVERVLQLAGLGSGRPLPMTRVAPDALVREAVRLASADAAEAGVHVHVEIAPNLPPVMGDAGALQSAVHNLVGNAIKYAGADRWVRVAVTAQRAPRSEVVISVEDHGAGLDAEEQQLVFEPFFRGKTAVAHQIKGSGLGLSLVKRISDAHGGRVQLVSAPGKGSTFTICLPAAPDTTAAPAADAVDSHHAAATEA